MVETIVLQPVLNMTCCDLMTTVPSTVSLISSIPDTTLTNIRFVILTELCILFGESYIYCVDQNYMMALHHLFEFIAISCSIYYIPVVTLYVLVLHHASDVFLDFSKAMLSYFEMTGKKYYEHIAHIVFAIFIVAWVWSRLIFFPKFILDSIYSLYNTDDTYAFYFMRDCVSKSKVITTSCIAITMLIFLFVLHIIWSRIIYNKVSRLVCKKKISNNSEKMDHD